MRLRADQVEEFERRGCLLVPGLFTVAEIATLEAALPAVVAGTDEARRTIDEASGTVRMVHGSHRTSSAFAALARHPRLVGPAGQLLGGPVYLYQSRLNLKAGLVERPTAGYPWHQDFSTWHHRDGLPEPRAVVVFTFLDEVTACNAPLMVVPGSHRRGLLGAPDGGGGAAGADPEGGYRQLVLPAAVLADLVAEGGIEAVTGGAGSVFFMHANLVHGSTENISPLRRAIYSLAYCAVGNHPADASPEHFAARDRAPIEPLADDCLAP